MRDRKRYEGREEDGEMAKRLEEKGEPSRELDEDAGETFSAM